VHCWSAVLIEEQGLALERMTEAGDLKCPDRDRQFGVTGLCNQVPLNYLNLAPASKLSAMRLLTQIIARLMWVNYGPEKGFRLSTAIDSTQA